MITLGGVAEIGSIAIHSIPLADPSTTRTGPPLPFGDLDNQSYLHDLHGNHHLLAPDLLGLQADLRGLQADLQHRHQDQVQVLLLPILLEVQDTVSHHLQPHQCKQEEAAILLPTLLELRNTVSQTTTNRNGCTKPERSYHHPQSHQ